MKKKYAPPAERDRLPPLLVGDEPVLTGALVPATAVEVEAPLPDDPHVVTEGADMERWVFLAPALLLALIGGMSVAQAWPGDGTPYFAVVILCALMGWAGHQYVVKHRKEFRLTDEGIVLEVRHRIGGEPRVTCIPWAEMRVYTAVADADEAFLYVVDHRGDTLTLNDFAPRPSSQEFIRRFVERAERQGIAARPAAQTAPPARDDGESRALGCMAVFLGLALVTDLADKLALSGAQPGAALAGIALAAWLWHTLTDDDVAYRDRTSRKLVARLRRWMRGVLRIRVI